MVNDVVANKIVDAYKVNPLLAALIIIDIVTLVGAAWYLIEKDRRTAEYVTMMQNTLTELRYEALDIAKQCVIPVTPRDHKKWNVPDRLK